MNWYTHVWKNYAVFSGRAGRAEYWHFYLWNTIISFVLAGVDVLLMLATGTGMGALSGLYMLAVLIPSLAVTTRRLHDTNRSGWWIWFSFVPLIGVITLLVFLAQESKPGAYGPSSEAARQAA